MTPRGSTTEQAPWWLVAIQRLGPVTVIALGLVWFLKHDVAEAQARTQATLEQHVLDMKVEYTQMTYYLQAICLNAADDADERARCQIITGERFPVDRK